MNYERIAYGVTCALAAFLVLAAGAANAEDDAPLTLTWASLRPAAPVDRELSLEERLAALGAEETLTPEASGMIGAVSHGEAISLGMFDDPGSDDSELVRELDQRLVRIGGYALPLDYGPDGARVFLLVPYVGACVHVPPPPENQIILVESEEPVEFQGLFLPYAVTGVMHVGGAALDIAEVGYRIEAVRVDAMDF